MHHPELTLSLEMMGAIASARLTLIEITDFKRDAKSFLFSNFNIELNDLQIAVVENTHSEIHLTLPYYANLQSRALALQDEQVAKASAGGELVFVSVVVGGLVLVGSIFLSAIIGSLIVDEQTKDQRKPQPKVKYVK